MPEYEFNPGDKYWAFCESCFNSNPHKYLGLQPTIPNVVEGIHMGVCGNCDTTRAINLQPSKLETHQKD